MIVDKGLTQPLAELWTLETPAKLSQIRASPIAQLVKNLAAMHLIPGLGRSPGEGKGYPLQYSGLKNSMDCIVPGVAKSWTWLSDFSLSLSSKARGQCFVPLINLSWVPLVNLLLEQEKADILGWESTILLNSIPRGGSQVWAIISQLFQHLGKWVSFWRDRFRWSIPVVMNVIEEPRTLHCHTFHNVSIGVSTQMGRMTTSRKLSALTLNWPMPKP